MDVLRELAEVLEARKGHDPADSYVAGLYRKGTDAIADKVEEEAREVAEAARSGETERLVYETADLWFHSLVMLSHRGMGPQHVLEELRRRFGVSGLTEKANRKA